MRRLIYFSLILLAALASAQTPDTVHFEPMPDRWRIVPPAVARTAPAWRWYDPFHQNEMKGDRPFWGQNNFYILTVSSASEFVGARVPTPSGVSTNAPNRASFFGNGNRFIWLQTALASLELYHGDTAFRPRDLSFKFEGAFNFNYQRLGEQGITNIDPNRGLARSDRQFAIQELSIEKHLLNLSSRYDFLSLKVGIQPFASDFRRFMFVDKNLGVRLFGNLLSNKWQYNAAWFYLLEKNTNSELNTVFDDRDQQIYVANLYRQDWPALGFTTQISYHLNYDRASRYSDNNGFPTRPAPIGANTPHAIRAHYLGAAGSGHFGSWNVDAAFYHVVGSDSRSQFAGQRIGINAQMFALEFSRDYDWRRYLVSLFYASADANPQDATGRGFDAILDAPAFAGGPFSWWNTQSIGLLGLELKQRNSLIPNLRTGKFEGQANFVNPGVLILNAAFEAELTPKLRAVANVNYLRFVNTNALLGLINQARVRNAIGFDYGIGARWRPFLDNNAIAQFALTALQPLGGFADVFQTKQWQFAVILNVMFTY